MAWGPSGEVGSQGLRQAMSGTTKGVAANGRDKAAASAASAGLEARLMEATEARGAGCGRVRRIARGGTAERVRKGTMSR